MTHPWPSDSVERRDDVLWYALKVLVGREFKCAERLQRKGLQIYVPTKKRWRSVSRHTRRAELSSYPLLTGYIFFRAALSGGEWRRAFDVPGVYGVLEVDGEPTALRNGEMEDLQARERKGEFKAFEYERWLREGKGFRVGDKVSVVAGPFSGYSYTVARINDRKAFLDIEIFGVNRLVEIPLEAIEAV
jgi:transcription antitermination factor NusG